MGQPVPASFFHESKHRMNDGRIVNALQVSATAARIGADEKARHEILVTLRDGSVVCQEIFGRFWEAPQGYHTARRIEFIVDQLQER